MDGVSSVFSGTQVVSQLCWNQLVIYKNKEVKLKTYFDSYLVPGVKKNADYTRWKGAKGDGFVCPAQGQSSWAEAIYYCPEIQRGRRLSLSDTGGYLSC